MSKLIVADSIQLRARPRGGVRPGPEPPEPPEPPLAGIEGVRASAGLQVNSFKKIDQLADYALSTKLNRAIPFATSNIGWRRNASGVKATATSPGTDYGQALGNARLNFGVRLSENVGCFREHPETTVCSTLALIQEDLADTRNYPSVAYRDAEWDKVIAGDYDSVWTTIAGYIVDYCADVKLSRTSTGGTITLTIDGQTTGTVAATAAGFTKSALQAAIRALGADFAQTVVMSKNADGTGPLYIEWPAAVDDPTAVTLTVNNGGATGGTVTKSTTHADVGGCPPPIIRLGHEPEGGFYPWSKVGIDETKWVTGWTHVRDILKAYIPSIRIDYQGNGPFLRTNWRQHVINVNEGKSAAYLATVPPASETRMVWEFGLPDEADFDIFGCDLYIGQDGRLPAEFYDRLDQLQQIAFDLGKPFSLPELGASPGPMPPSPALRKGTAGLQDDPAASSEQYRSVKKWLQTMITMMEGYPATGPGSCAYWSHFEKNNDYQMIVHWPHAWLEYRQVIGDA